MDGRREREQKQLNEYFHGGGVAEFVSRCRGGMSTGTLADRTGGQGRRWRRGRAGAWTAGPRGGGGGRTGAEHHRSW